MFLLRLCFDHVPELRVIGIEILTELEGILAKNVLSFLIGKKKGAGHAAEGGSGDYN